MGSYYYLVSQLPFLIYGQKPPMTAEAFRELARPMLEEEDRVLLDMVSLDPLPGAGFTYTETVPPCGSDFIDRWREWERVLRLNLAKHRSVKTKREGTIPFEPPVIPAEAAAMAARAVTAAETPLEVDILIDKARWSAIETLQGIGYFDRNTVFAYLLKLLILERRSAMQTETGFSEYNSLYAAIVGSVAVPGGVQSGTTPAGEVK